MSNEKYENWLKDFNRRRHNINAKFDDELKSKCSNEPEFEKWWKEFGAYQPVIFEDLDN